MSILHFYSAFSSTNTIDIDRESNQDQLRPITINVNNNIRVYMPAAEVADQSRKDRPNLNTNDEDGDDESSEDDSSGSASETGSSGSSSQHSVTYATPPPSYPSVGHALPPTS